MKQTMLFATLVGMFGIGLTAFSQEQTKISNPVTMQSFDQLTNIHDQAKTVSAEVLFAGKEGVVRTLQIKKDGILREHITHSEAILICVTGEAIYEDEMKLKYTLKPGYFVRITPNVKHWVTGVIDSQLLLIK